MKSVFEQRLSDLVAKPLFWIVLILAIISVPVSRALGGTVPQPPKLKMALPAFELVNEYGDPYGSANLEGRVWVADFMFTSCPTACPKLTKRMKEIQHRTRFLGDSFHLVSFTVDPENDTPERLHAYARASGSLPMRWSFLTGPLDQIEKTVVKGFKIAAGKEPTEADPTLFSIFHGEKLVLVDRGMMIRGYYDADDEGIANLLRDAGTLANL